MASQHAAVRQPRSCPHRFRTAQDWNSIFTWKTPSKINQSGTILKGKTSSFQWRMRDSRFLKGGDFITDKKYLFPYQAQITHNPPSRMPHIQKGNINLLNEVKFCRYVPFFHVTIDSKVAPPTGESTRPHPCHPCRQTGSERVLRPPTATYIHTR